MQKLVPNIWCNDNADEMARFYLEAFPGATLANHARYPEEGLLEFQRPFAGKTLQVDVVIDGFAITLINADDTFRPGPALSLRVVVGTPQEAERLTSALSSGGRVLRPLGDHPLHELFAWVEDPYGVSWQVLVGHGPAIAPCLNFAGPAQGKAQAALDKYVASFPNSRAGESITYAQLEGNTGDAAEAQDPSQLALGVAWLDGEPVYAQDFCGFGGAGVAGGDEHFAFDCGAALLYQAHGQQQLDAVWEALSAVPEAERCGWLRDEFGVAWEVVPDNLGELMQRAGAYEKLMAMTKIVVAEF